jgi:hypothetical protein
LPDVIVPAAVQHAVEDLPVEAIVYLLGSRYCETDRLSDFAWKLFEKTTPGWARVQAICDFVHNHVAFGYEHARATMTAWEVFNEGKGVCRDYAHLAIAFCRCMNKGPICRSLRWGETKRSVLSSLPEAIASGSARTCLNSAFEMARVGRSSALD